MARFFFSQYSLRIIQGTNTAIASRLNQSETGLMPSRGEISNWKIGILALDYMAIRAEKLYSTDDEVLRHAQIMPDRKKYRVSKYCGSTLNYGKEINVTFATP